MFAPAAYDDRDRSQTPPMFYSTYPPPEDMMMAPYSSAPPSFRPMTTEAAYADWTTTTAVPVTLPPMTHFSDAIKRETFPGDDSMSPYMSYGFMPSMDVTAASPYDHHSNPNVSSPRGSNPPPPPHYLPPPPPTSSLPPPHAQHHHHREPPPFR